MLVLYRNSRASKGFKLDPKIIIVLNFAQIGYGNIKLCVQIGTVNNTIIYLIVIKRKWVQYFSKFRIGSN